jgi:two-component system, NarL family, sensor histidine kinase DevS
MSRGLLRGNDDDEVTSALRLVAELSLRAARADLVTISVPDDATDLRVAVAVGEQAAQLQGRMLDRRATVAGRVLMQGRPLSLAHPADAGLETAASRQLDVGPLMAVPLTGAARVHGVLCVIRFRGRSAFTTEDLDLLTSFTTQAALAIELAEARAEQQRATLLDDRERIAEDLHDHVIQKLFAAGMSLQAATAGLRPGRETDRVLGVIDDLDDTISQIRTTIFQLQRTRPALRSGVRSRLLDVATEAAPPLGFEPAVRFRGVADTLRGAVADDLVAVLREALSNVGRHAHATSAEVVLTVKPDQVVLDVLDDGAGPPPDSESGNGLANLRHRAERHGGTFSFGPGDQGGSRLLWSVPLG